MKMRNFLIAMGWVVAVLSCGLDRAGAQTYGPDPNVNYDLPNFAYSPTNMQKFVDSLPGLDATATNNLGQYIPIAVADTNTYPGSDYYEIALVEYREQMHSDLPPVVGANKTNATGGTQLRGYLQETNGVAIGQPHYLGPIIVATKDRPVRVKFTNRLPIGTPGNLFLPADITMMGAGTGPSNTTELYTQNRATLHLHGGLPGWESDGTPHQWITPAGESTSYPKGDSVQNVPDMPVPANGSMTFYWPNQQSGRLLFYHDHAYGMTGPNVYGGEAAGYLVVDTNELGLIAAGFIPSNQIPLIIQDKTFVPDAVTLAATDPLWDTNNWGGLGNLWYPHVYVPNQDPFNLTGATQYGRWDYGPWFWPIFPVSGLIPTVSHVPESFMDTPVVNGTAYPYVNVQPTAYRFRILNACNDRVLNLQLWQADPTNYAVGGFGTEVRMIPAVAGTNIPAWYPAMDGRDGGVPDPTLEGPRMIQIGAECGLLPAPVTHINVPVGYEYNRRNIVVLNILEKTLLLAAAERADVIIDFSQFAGKTVILYNDAPAPVPASDPRYDLYTGDQDLTGGGGAPSTVPGYGPNTRTIMQFRVAAGTPVPFNPSAAFTNALMAAYRATQDPPIIKQAAYGATFGTNYADVFARIQDNYMVSTPQPVASIAVTAGGAGYTTPPTVSLLGGLGTNAAATAYIFGGSVTGITLTNPGTNYVYAPTVILTGGNGFGATAAASLQNAMAIQPKCIQELFDPLGRMNATLGTELPFTSAFIQTTIPLGYIDPATEIIAEGETQIWKITHNGVDTHGVHFHLVNVQVINRVGWDGAIRPPDPNELGWKETVRMNPLEDIIVAATARGPRLPYGLPDSVRALDVTQPLGSTMGFSGVDPYTGNPMVVSNVMANFGWEYVWHCHLLGHEENDMMRPLVFTVISVIPAAPVLTATYLTNPVTVNLQWTDGTPASAPTTLGNPTNEIGFRVQRAPILANGLPGVYANIAAIIANTTNYTDTTVLTGNQYSYRVVAYNQAGSAVSTAVTVGPQGVPVAPSSLTVLATPLSTNAPTVTIRWTDRSNNELGFIVQRATNPSFTTGVTNFTVGANVTAYTNRPVALHVTYYYRVLAYNAVGNSTYSNTGTVTTPGQLPVAPSNLAITVPASPTGRTTLNLTWRDNSSNEQGFTIQRSTSPGGPWTTIATRPANTTAYANSGLTPNTLYYYRIQSFNTDGTSAFTPTVSARTRP